MAKTPAAFLIACRQLPQLRVYLFSAVTSAKPYNASPLSPLLCGADCSQPPKAHPRDITLSRSYRRTASAVLHTPPLKASGIKQNLASARTAAFPDYVSCLSLIRPLFHSQPTDFGSNPYHRATPASHALYGHCRKATQKTILCDIFVCNLKNDSTETACLKTNGDF